MKCECVFCRIAARELFIQLICEVCIFRTCLAIFKRSLNNYRIREMSADVNDCICDSLPYC